jgi:hypothetical protein
MPELDDAIKIILEETHLVLSVEENKMAHEFDKEIYEFSCKIQEIVEDFTEDKPITETMLKYLILRLASSLADINNHNDLT